MATKLIERIMTTHSTTHCSVWVANMNTLTHVNFNLGLYSTFEERQVNTDSDGHSFKLAATHTHEQYDKIATFRDRSLQSEKECLRSKKKGDITACDHEMTP